MVEGEGRVAPESPRGKGKGDEMREATGRVGLNEILSLL